MYARFTQNTTHDPLRLVSPLFTHAHTYCLLVDVTCAADYADARMQLVFGLTDDDGHREDLLAIVGNSGTVVIEVPAGTWDKRLYVEVNGSAGGALNIDNIALHNSSCEEFGEWRYRKLCLL